MQYGHGIKGAKSLLSNGDRMETQEEEEEERERVLVKQGKIMRNDKKIVEERDTERGPWVKEI